MPRSTPHGDAAFVVGSLLRAQGTRRGGASLKSLVYSDRVTNKKATYAICCETLRHLNTIRAVVAEVDALSAGAGGKGGKQDGLLYVWVYELLFGRWAKTRKHERHAGVAMHERAIRDAHARVSEQQNSMPKPKQRPPPPRYVRVNTIRMAVAEAASALERDLGEPAKPHALLSDLLSLPGACAERLHDHTLVRQGAVVLQGLASAMPAHALAPQPGWDVVDACAAPGNKTTQVAAMVGRTGRVFAFDSSKERFARLVANARRCGVDGIVQAKCCDFFGIDGTADGPYANVRAVLLDPSCSGSGRLTEERRLQMEGGGGGGGERGGPSSDANGEDDKRRVDILAAFQEKIVR